MAIVLLAGVVGSAVAEDPQLIAAFFVKGKVGLKWRPIDGITEYNIYRKSADGEYAKISATDKDHFFDTDLVPGATYTYKISIVGGDGTEKFSAEKNVTIPGMAEGEFAPPSWVGLRVDQSKILLNWDPVPNALAYNILRSTTPGGEYEVVGNSQTSKFADNTGLERGQTYYYVLTAMNADFEETEQSEERSIKFGMIL